MNYNNQALVGTAPSSQMDEGIGKLSAAIEDLERRQTTLFNRLDPVCVPAPPAVDCAKLTPTQPSERLQSPVTGQIRTCAERIRNVNEALDVLQQRLTV